MDWNGQHCQGVNLPLGDLCIKCNPNQIVRYFLVEIDKLFL